MDTVTTHTLCRYRAIMSFSTNVNLDNSSGTFPIHSPLARATCGRVLALSGPMHSEQIVTAKLSPCCFTPALHNTCGVGFCIWLYAQRGADAQHQSRAELPSWGGGVVLSSGKYWDLLQSRINCVKIGEIRWQGADVLRVSYGASVRCCRCS